MTDDASLRSGLTSLVVELSEPVDTQRALLAIEGCSTRRRRRDVRVGAAIVAVLVVGLVVVAFRSVGREAERPGLELYNPTAIEAAGPKLPASNAFIAETMEDRYICSVLHDYVEMGDPSADTEIPGRFAGSQRRLRTFTSGSGEKQLNIDEFVDFATSVVHRSSTSGSFEPTQAFIRSECDATQNYDIPVLAPGQR